MCITVGTVEVWVEVVRGQNDRLRLGFAAPPGVVIDREEVYRRKERARLEAELCAREKPAPEDRP